MSHACFFPGGIFRGPPENFPGAPRINGKFSPVNPGAYSEGARIPYVTVKQRDFLVFRDFDDVVVFSRAGCVGPGIYGGKKVYIRGAPGNFSGGPRKIGKKSCMGHIHFAHVAVE